MKNPLAIFREAGSFIAGLLIGLSIVVFVFAMVDPGDRQAFWGIFGTFIILAAGLTLQVVVTAQCRRTTAPELGALPIGFIE